MAALTPWVGVDLDGTLAHYEGWVNGGEIGAPVPRMVARVKAWLKAGTDVRIFTARVAPGHQTAAQIDAEVKRISAWCVEHLGQTLPITATKDFGMVTLYDDRAVQVMTNSGVTVSFDL